MPPTCDRNPSYSSCGRITRSLPFTVASYASSWLHPASPRMPYTNLVLIRRHVLSSENVSAPLAVIIIVIAIVIIIVVIIVAIVIIVIAIVVAIVSINRSSMSFERMHV